MLILSTLLTSLFSATIEVCRFMIIFMVMGALHYYFLWVLERPSTHGVGAPGHYHHSPALILIWGRRSMFFFSIHPSLSSVTPFLFMLFTLVLNTRFVTIDLQVSSNY